jgi:hypothetical protein
MVRVNGIYIFGSPRRENMPTGLGLPPGPLKGVNCYTVLSPPSGVLGGPWVVPLHVVMANPELNIYYDHLYN